MKVNAIFLLTAFAAAWGGMAWWTGDGVIGVAKHVEPFRPVEAGLTVAAVWIVLNSHKDRKVVDGMLLKFFVFLGVVVVIAMVFGGGIVW
jgi:hypothetical protein